jgi:outer membrane protein assembly factor BamB
MLRNRDFFVGALALALCGVAGVCHGVEPVLEWAYETTGKIYASPILADLEGDGAVEVIVAASRAQRILCLTGEGALKWDFQLDDGVSDGFQATPSVVDYDGDGKKEVFWLSKGGTAGCLDSQGQLVWRVFVGDHMDYAAPVVADVNGDGRIEVLFGAESGTLYCLDDVGQVLWRHQEAGKMRGIPAVAPLGDGTVMRIYACFGGGVMACFDQDGNVVWRFDTPGVKGERWSNVSAGDMDGDGRLEVVAATEDFQVIVRDAETGAEEWRWKGKGKIDQTASFALADFSGTGGLDIVTGDYSGHVYRLRDGEAVWTTQVAQGRGGVVQGPSVGDVDGDGALEVLVCARSNRLICLSEDGEEEWSFPTSAGPLTTPALGDIDGDGEVEIVFTCKDKKIRCLSVGGAYNPDALPWPMMAHDAQLSNHRDGPFFEAAAVSAQEVDPDRALTVLDSDGLRMGVNRLPVSFQNQSRRRRHIELSVRIVISDDCEGFTPRPPKAQFLNYRRSFVAEPFAVEEVDLDWTLYQGGDIETYAELTDLGTGALLEEYYSIVMTTALSVERQEAAAALERAQTLLPSWPNEAVRAKLTDYGDLYAGVEVDGVLDRAAFAEAQAKFKALQRLVARLEAANATPGKTDAFAAVAETPLTKVFRDEPFLLEAQDAAPARIALARNEYESVQLVVVPLWRDLKGLEISVGPLRHQNGGADLPEDAVSIHTVGYVEIGPSEYEWRVEKQGWYPDVLLPHAPMDVPAGQDAQPFFITVRTQADTAPGPYTGMIHVSASEGGAVDIPLEVAVWDFALPEETTLKTSFWMNTRTVQAFYGYEKGVPWDVRKAYYDLHLEHRVSPIKDFPMNGGPLLEDFDYLMANGQNNFFLPVPDLFETEQRPPYLEKVQKTKALLEEKGWLDKALFYSHDEVAVMARHKIPQIVEQGRWLREAVPEIPVLQTSAPEQSLVGLADIWCPCIDTFDPAMLKQRKAAGEGLWFYTVWGRPGIMIEFPNTDYRMMFWQCWKYGAEGFLYWGTTHWAYNLENEKRWPEKPWTTYNSQPGHNGCGYMVYPGADGQPLASTRLHLTRDGIEDYEYFALLKGLQEEKAANLPKDLLDRIDAALTIDPKVVKDHKDFTEDAETLLQARKELAQLIEEAQKQ